MFILLIDWMRHLNVSVSQVLSLFSDMGNIVYFTSTTSDERGTRRLCVSLDLQAWAQPCPSVRFVQQFVWVAVRCSRLTIMSHCLRYPNSYRCSAVYNPNPIQTSLRFFFFLLFSNWNKYHTASYFATDYEIWCNKPNLIERVWFSFFQLH